MIFERFLQFLYSTEEAMSSMSSFPLSDTLFKILLNTSPGVTLT